MGKHIVIKNIKDGYCPDDDDVERLINYIAGKGGNEDVEYAICGACGLSENYYLAINQMVSLQYFVGKITGRRVYHWIVSFDDNLSDVNLVIACAKSIAEYFYYEMGHSCFWGVHTSTDNLHVHIAVNAISRLDAKKWHTSKIDLQKIKQDISEICDSIIEKI